MSTRQETETPKRTYRSTQRPISSVPKYRSGSDWSKMPDYDRLPDCALIGISEVSLISGMSKSVVERRIKSGDFAAPKYHGKNRVWSLGYVRQWCNQFGQQF